MLDVLMERASVKRLGEEEEWRGVHKAGKRDESCFKALSV